MVEKFSFDPSLRIPLVEAKLFNAEGQPFTCLMAIDTGATRTMLHTVTAESMGYDLSSPRVVRPLQTGGGTRQTPYIQINRIEVLAHFQDAPVVGVNNFKSNLGFRGLLGADFFKRNKLSIDYRKGLVWMT